MVQGPWRVLTCPTATAVRWWGLRGPGSVRRTGTHCRNCSAADRRCPRLPSKGSPCFTWPSPGPSFLTGGTPRAFLVCCLRFCFVPLLPLQIPVCSPSEPDSFQNTSHFHPVTQHNGFLEKLCCSSFLLLWWLCCVTGTPPAAVSGHLKGSGGECLPLLAPSTRSPTFKNPRSPTCTTINLLDVPIPLVTVLQC